MGDSMRSTVRKAARLAVYEEIMMSVKNHHIPATIRVDRALKVCSGVVVFEQQRSQGKCETYDLRFSVR